MSLILGIESTCDETAAAVVADGWDVRSNVVATQIELHAKYRGVVPEIASRAHIQNILPVLRESLEVARVTLEEIDAICVTHRPGLIGSLLIGLTAAKTLAWALDKPFIGVDHVQAHLYSVKLAAQRKSFFPSFGTPGAGEGGGRASDVNAIQPPPHSSPAGVPEEEERRDIPMPAVGLAVSGGHTSLYHLESFSQIQLLGSTLDDAVGEAYDKVAAILGLGYPGGPVIDGLAANGSATAIKFPRTLLGKRSLDFSFSGIKTAVLYHVRGFQGRQRRADSLSPAEVRDVAASFQAACIDVIVQKLRRALSQTRAKCIIIGGGVSANRGLRQALQRFDVPAFFPLLPYCTDNAAMSAGLANLLLHAGHRSPLDLNAQTQSEFAVTP